MTEKAFTHIFPNGLRLIQVSSPTDVAYCGISIDAGTRDENADEFGMAHFCEHMMFKGTSQRSATNIINRMESVGGDLNAYTNKEETVIYSVFLRQHLWRAIELILDIVMKSTFPQNEIDKESEVIIDEIESYNDSPSELIFDRFENVIYKDTSLGHDILGTPESVRTFNTDSALLFTKRLYRYDRMVMFIYGKCDAEKIVHRLEPLMSVPDGFVPEPIQNITPLFATPIEGNIIEEKRDTHQSHVMIGTAAYGSKDPRRIALYFLNNLLGGPGMNSRLNIALRERRGLVYTVESSLTNYTDTSTWAIYFGCDHNDTDKCIRLVHNELDKLIQSPLSQRKFDAAMRQLKGQLGVACDNFENYALDTAKCFLHYNKFEGMADTFAHLDNLTPAFLQEVAQDIFNPKRLVTYKIY